MAHKLPLSTENRVVMHNFVVCQPQEDTEEITIVLAVADQWILTYKQLFKITHRNPRIIIGFHCRAKINTLIKIKSDNSVAEKRVRMEDWTLEKMYSTIREMTNCTGRHSVKSDTVILCF